MSVADPERLSYVPLSLRSGGGWWRRARLRMVASWRAEELDRQLAAGASTGASAVLAIRGRRLTGRRFRGHIAGGLTRVVRDAEATTRGFTAAVRPDRREVLAARPLLATLDRRLRGDEPVTPQGVALLELLLTDGNSPLYQPTEPGALGSRLRAAAAALDPYPHRDGIHPARESLR
ncbi:MAG TPA: hypothetical protein VMB27_26915 [Solirubrobacteraceae bacterium]|nr:hypothetical protein [Solirubrobacteraceae bacterium]